MEPKIVFLQKKLDILSVKRYYEYFVPIEVNRAKGDAYGFFIVVCVENSSKKHEMLNFRS